MEVIKKQRLAVCRILLDVVEGACEVRDPDLIMRTRHYPATSKGRWWFCGSGLGRSERFECTCLLGTIQGIAL